MNPSESPDSLGDIQARECPVCGAKWVGGQLFWATGKPGRDIDLAGLICNMMEKRDRDKASKCINPCKGREGGDTWASRLKNLGTFEEEKKKSEDS